MSLHKFADMVAKQGRGDDSLLIHMTPDEVRNLQKFAEANGKTLTINPTTGLPEAGMLSDLFKTIAPIALGAFLGPAGLAFGGPGLTAGMAGLATGGITALATGSLSRGLMAGLGAYGGAGIGESLMNAGTGALSSAAGAGLVGDEAIQQAVGAKLASATPMETLTAGFNSATASPAAMGTFAKNNLTNIGMAAAPIMAGAMVPTTTKMPENTNPAYIRQKLYDPYTQTYKSLTPVKASEFGGRNFSDAYTNPQTGEMATLQPRTPSGFAGGGITSLAKGGVGATLAIQQDNASAGQPSLTEWLEKAGLSQKVREIGSPDLYKAVSLYNVVGSSLDPYRQKDTRDWAAVMNSDNPMEALIQQNLPLYGGAGHIELTDTGGRLVSGAGDNLTSDLSRYEEFGIKLDPTQLKTQLNSINTSTPIGRTQYNRINALYEEAVRQAQEYTNSMAGGGIVALANGGVPGYANGMLVGDQDVFNYFKGLDQAKLKSGALDAQIAADMQKYNVGAADIGRITGTQANQGDFEKRFVQAINPATLSSADFLAKTADVGLTDQALANAMKNSGMSAAAQYAATHKLDDTAGVTGAGKSFYDAYGYKAGDAPGDTGGIAGLYTNIDYAADKLQAQIDAGALTVAQAQNLSLAEMERLGINQADVKAATGSDFASLFKAKKAVDKTCGKGYHWDEASQSCVKDTVTATKIEWKDCGTGYHWDKATQACVKNINATQNTTDTVDTATSLVTAGANTLPVGVGGTTGPSIEGGGATVNPNGTITTSPVIPGIPVGGFTGMTSLRDAYTKGGGSLGYIPKAPRTMAEFDQLYNKQTGDSLAAYDYLMGKGGGKYPTQSKAASTGEGIMRPYFSAGMKYKPKFLSYDKDGEITSSTTSGKSGDAKTAELTKAKTIEVVDSSGYNTETYTAVLQEDGTYLAGNGKRYDVTGKQIAAGGGMMGYAVGGGLGSLGSYSDGGRLLRGPGDGVSDSIPATIGAKNQPARLADGEFVIPARIVSELGNGSTDAGAKKLYAMMDRVQRARGKTTGKNKVAANSRSDKYLPA